jgi:hypothetical protein
MFDPGSVFILTQDQQRRLSPFKKGGADLGRAGPPLLPQKEREMLNVFENLIHYCTFGLPSAPRR